MKLIKLKHSLLFLRIDTDTDTVKCFFLFFISWNCFKGDAQIFNFDKLTIKQVKEFYINLADDWTRKYRI